MIPGRLYACTERVDRHIICLRRAQDATTELSYIIELCLSTAQVIVRVWSQICLLRYKYGLKVVAINIMQVSTLHTPDISSNITELTSNCKSLAPNLFLLD
jgi:hypothetical protein